MSKDWPNWMNDPLEFWDDNALHLFWRKHQPRKPFEKADKHPPKFCSWCGSPNVSYVECSNRQGDIVWDTYCDTCGWSGGVTPDADQGYYGDCDTL